MATVTKLKRNGAMPTFAKIVAAHQAAEGTLIRMEVENERFVVRDLVADRIIKRFRPHHIGREALHWIDDNFVDGVFVTTLASHERALRFRRRTWEPNNIKRAYEATNTEYPGY